MDISGEVAKIHRRTDAKNLVTSARTIHLLEQKMRPSHMEVFMILLTFQPKIAW